MGLINPQTSALAQPSQAWRRWSASSAPSPAATPQANVIRPDSAGVIAPTANQSAPQRAARGPKWARASGANSAAEITPASAPSSAGESSHDSGGTSTLYDQVGCPEY